MEASEQVPEKVNSNPLFCTDPSERKTMVSAPLAAVDVMAGVATGLTVAVGSATSLVSLHAVIITMAATIAAAANMIFMVNAFLFILE